MMCCNSCVISDDDDDDVESLQRKSQDVVKKSTEKQEITFSSDSRTEIVHKEQPNQSEAPKEKVKVDLKQEVGCLNEEVLVEKGIILPQTIPEKVEKVTVIEREVQTTEKIFGVMSSAELQTAVNRLEAVASRLESLAQKSSSGGSGRSTGAESGTCNLKKDFIHSSMKCQYYEVLGHR